MGRYRLELGEWERFEGDLRRAPAEVHRIIGNAAHEAELVIVAATKQSAPVFEGTLASSIDGGVTREAKVGGGGRTIAEISSPVAYAKIVDTGRRPGRMPPHEPIARWVELKLFKRTGEAGEAGEVDRVAYLIRRKIARRGTKGTRYIQKAIMKSKTGITSALNRMSAAIARILT
jgi:hypothetical protein